jgi:hypothetical protein
LLFSRIVIKGVIQCGQLNAGEFAEQRTSPQEEWQMGMYGERVCTRAWQKHPPLGSGSASWDWARAVISVSSSRTRADLGRAFCCWLDFDDFDLEDPDGFGEDRAGIRSDGRDEEVDQAVFFMVDDDDDAHSRRR